MTLNSALLLTFLAACALAQSNSKYCLNQVENVCTECDTSQFYYLQFGACQQFTGLHCLSIDQNGACLQCDEGFFLSTSGTCIYVEDRVKNCAEYTDKKGYIECLTCAKGFILVRQNCFPETENCQSYYPGRNRCQVCNEGFQLSSDRFSCEKANLQAKNN